MDTQPQPIETTCLILARQAKRDAVKAYKSMLNGYKHGYARYYASEALLTAIRAEEAAFTAQTAHGVDKLCLLDNIMRWKQEVNWHCKMFDSAKRN